MKRHFLHSQHQAFNCNISFFLIHWLCIRYRNNIIISFSSLSLLQVMIIFMIQLLTCVIYISLFFVQSRVKIKLMLKCQLCWCHLDDFTKVASATFLNFLMYYFEKSCCLKDLTMKVYHT